MYSQIDSNKRKTWVLISLVSAFIVFLFYIFALVYDIDPGATVITGTMIATVYALFAYYLSDKAALMSAGAKEIQKKDAPDVWRLTENLCIASGLPMPKVYIINDRVPNAFATGRDPEHASIALTTGLLKILNKQELEGVIAHELSHIKNFDIRIMTITVVLVGLIILIADIFLRIGLHSGGGNKKSGQAGLILLVIGIILAILSPLIAQVIKLAVSRTREYLADASGALMTRYPEGLASALEKLGQHSGKMQRANHASAHLYISNPFGEKKQQKQSFFSKLFSTHPPIEERIQKLRNISA